MARASEGLQFRANSLMIRRKLKAGIIANPAFGPHTR
jgi:hypothetical protein